MNTSVGKYFYFILCFIFWLFLALFSSKLIVDNLTSGHHYSNLVFSLHYVKNSGAAFSLLQNAREFLIIVSIVATTFLFMYVHNHIRNIHLISIGGGIIQDITGLVANILYRGIKWTFIPTTLSRL